MMKHKKDWIDIDTAIKRTKTIKVSYIKDECYPVYTIFSKTDFSDGIIELTKEEKKRFEKAEKEFWKMQNWFSERTKGV